VPTRTAALTLPRVAERGADAGCACPGTMKVMSLALLAIERSC
jgi:hypothetical protein